MLSKAVLTSIVLLITTNLQATFAQATSNVTCQANYQWMINTRSQTPCLVSAYLSAQCNNGQWSVPTLNSPGPYVHPTGAAANICRCNTVVYNLIQACSVCQGGNIGGWVDWISNCSQSIVTIDHYPLPLPVGVAIPNWAYLDFTRQDQFQVQVARQNLGTSPESVSPSDTVTGTFPIATSTASITAPPSPTSNTSKSNTSAIAGGVAGGALGLVLLGIMGWFIARKQRKLTPSNPAPAQENPPAEGSGGTKEHDPQGPGYSVEPYEDPRFTPAPIVQPGVHEQGSGVYTPYTTSTPYKPYDPNDPSTFPTTPDPGTGPTVTSQRPSYSDNSQQQLQPAQYKYIAEL